MSGGLHKDPETGNVTGDSNRCVGCWMCLMVCPFGAIAHNVETGIAVKCDLCKDEPEGPSCVQACPTKALVYCDEEEFKILIESDSNELSIKSEKE